VLNLAALIGTSIPFMTVRGEMRWWQILGVEVILVVLLGAAFVSARRIGEAYDRRLIDAYSMWARDHHDQAEGDRKAKGRARDHWRSKREGRLAARESPRRCDRAGAICYRMGKRGLTFFLVETNDRHRWTFPKGKLEGDESFEEAAVREAEEEAGVIGSVEGELTPYRYPGKASEGCPSVEVHPFLLLVEEIGDQAPGDRHRKRKWCTPEEARRKLAVRRDEQYKHQHAQVVAEAMSTITGT
jgi:8-oxo-dGTP pyrophosphatase MutT (NUDIX family)